MFALRLVLVCCSLVLRFRFVAAGLGFGVYFDPACFVAFVAGCLGLLIVVGFGVCFLIACVGCIVAFVVLGLVFGYLVAVVGLFGLLVCWF